jgi:hypothetical protein
VDEWEVAEQELAKSLEHAGELLSKVDKKTIVELIQEDRAPQ